MVNDPSQVDDGPTYAQPNKKTKEAAKNGTQPNGSKGKSPTGKGRESNKSLNIYHM